MRSYFGDFKRLKNTVLKLQKEIGEIPALSDETLLAEQVHSLVNKQLQVLKAVLHLYQMFEQGLITENPLDSQFLSQLESSFPRELIFAEFDPNRCPFRRLQSLINLSERLKWIYLREIVRKGVSNELPTQQVSQENGRQLFVSPEPNWSQQNLQRKGLIQHCAERVEK